MSASRSSTSSSPTETRSRPGLIPAASSSASVELALRGRRRVDDHRVDAARARRSARGASAWSMSAWPAARPPATSNASIPPAAPGRNWRMADRVLRVAGEARIEDAVHAVLALEPRGEGRGVPRVPLAADAEGQDPAQHEEGLERAERRAGVDLDALDVRDRAPPSPRRRRRSGRCGRRGTSSRTRRPGPRRARAGGRRTGWRRCCRRRTWRRGGGPARRSAAWSLTAVVGFAIVSAYRTRVGPPASAAVDRVEVGHVDDVDADAEAAEGPLHLGPRRAVDRGAAPRSGRPVRTSDASAAWIAPIPDATATPASPAAISA